MLPLLHRVYIKNMLQGNNKRKIKYLYMYMNKLTF